jgi:hypothetical protein
MAASSAGATRRFEYERVAAFADVQRLAAEGWRLVATTVAALDPHSGVGVTVYVMERPVA